MKRGLDYEKLFELFCNELSGAPARMSVKSEDKSEEAGTYVERVTLQANGEVRVSSCETYPKLVKGTGRYVYRPDKKDLANLTRIYGPLKPQQPITIKQSKHLLGE